MALSLELTEISKFGRTLKDTCNPLSTIVLCTARAWSLFLNLLILIAWNNGGLYLHAFTQYHSPKQCLLSARQEEHIKWSCSIKEGFLKCIMMKDEGCEWTHKALSVQQDECYLILYQQPNNIKEYFSSNYYEFNWKPVDFKNKMFIFMENSICPWVLYLLLLLSCLNLQ